jgi:hypothetical protein
MSSPTTGCPIEARWTRIWCVRPVCRCALSRSHAIEPGEANERPCARFPPGTDDCHTLSVCAGHGRVAASTRQLGPPSGAPRPAPHTAARIRRCASAAPSFRCARSVFATSEQPRRLLVETVDDPLAALRRSPADNSPPRPFNALTRVPRPVPRRRMDHHASRLIDHEHALVLVRRCPAGIVFGDDRARPGCVGISTRISISSARRAIRRRARSRR